jgi:hypothetical protein
MYKKLLVCVLVLSVVWLVSGCSTEKNPPLQGSSDTQPQNATTSESGSADPSALAQPENTPETPQVEVLPQSPLQVIIDSPLDGDVITSNQVQITGRTAPGAVVSAADSITEADEKGQFTLDIVLDSGLQLIEVEASTTSGEDIVVTLSVVIQPE